ncbi:MAG: GNAT family N-acetyltransferase [bacterium]|nr:GNAT family N-acetyltransferase [bacterium]
MKIRVHSFDPSESVPRTFLDLPDHVYRRDPHYQRPFSGSVATGLKRPEFAGRQRGFVVPAIGAPVARVVARVSPTLRDASQKPYGMLGFFEALDDSGAVAALFETAIEWFRERGIATVIGPIDGDTWHSYRLNAGPFEEAPFLMEPYNPPYYPELWRGNGFDVLETYLSQRASDLAAVVEAMAPKHRRALEAGYSIETLRLDRFDAELGRLYRLSLRVFAGNFLYTAISEESFLDLYRQSRALVDAELVFFARAPDGSDAGFLFAFPDRFRAVAAMQGKSHLLAKLKFLTLRNRTDSVNLKSLGVVPEHRKSGVGAALMYRAYKAALRKGYRHANLCLLRAGNPSGRLEGGRSQVFRRYELYERRL